MPRRQMKLKAGNGADLRAGFAVVRDQWGVPAGFPAAVLAEAEEAARAPRLPECDATEIPFLAVDPSGSRDLDQVLCIERRVPHGYRVRYAVADVAAFVRGAVDAEAHQRVRTLYLPDGNVPLYPPVLSENAASLLPGEIRPALLWTIDLDSSGESIGVDVRRALVRNRERLDYADAQLRIDMGADDERLQLLREVGQLCLERERERGGVSPLVPDQEIVQVDGGYTLEYRALPPVGSWNAQISLLTGMAAAELMMYGSVGILRVLPDVPDRELERLRRVAHALGVDWPPGVPYAEVVRDLDPNLPGHAAFLREASELLDGAGYVAFEGGVPEQAVHAAVAAEYAHVTAPLHRLADRYAAEICLALVAGADVPGWVRAALPRLPAQMARGDRRADQVERACVDLVQATLLRDRVGEVFDAVVVDVDDDRSGGLVQLRAPAVQARCDGEDLPLGQPVRVRLTTADPARREIRFAPA